MKAVMLLAVLTVLVLLPEGGDAGWFRDKVWQPVKRKVRQWWQRLKSKLGKRDIENVDLNEDGLLDESELEQAFGERHTRDLMDIMDVDDDISHEEFKRNIREIEEFDEEDE